MAESLAGKLLIASPSMSDYFHRTVILVVEHSDEGAFGLVVLSAHLAKDWIDRPRPDDPLVHTVGSSFPSGHAAYATAYVAMAVIATRVLGGVASRTAVVLGGVIVAAVIGGTRVYLRAHYLSDVNGGFALGLVIFAGCAALALVVGFIRQNAKR